MDILKGFIGEKQIEIIPEDLTVIDLEDKAKLHEGYLNFTDSYVGKPCSEACRHDGALTTVTI